MRPRKHHAGAKHFVRNVSMVDGTVYVIDNRGTWVRRTMRRFENEKRATHNHAARRRSERSAHASQVG